MGVDTTIISQGANLLQGGPINAPGDEKNWKKKEKKFFLQPLDVIFLWKYDVTTLARLMLCQPYIVAS